jgi:hypothetical protein
VEEDALYFPREGGGGGGGGGWGVAWPELSPETGRRGGEEGEEVGLYIHGSQPATALPPFPFFWVIFFEFCQNSSESVGGNSGRVW